MKQRIALTIHDEKVIKHLDNEVREYNQFHPNEKLDRTQLINQILEAYCFNDFGINNQLLNDLQAQIAQNELKIEALIHILEKQIKQMIQLFDFLNGEEGEE